MIKRFIIAALILAVFLGGLGYFQFVLKPAMIAGFIAKMVPPPATITAEPAKAEPWTDRVHSIGTLTAIQGVDVATEVSGIVTAYYFESGNDVQKGAKLVELDTSVEQADLASDEATLQEALIDFDRQSKLVKTGAVSQSVLDETIAKRDSAAAAVQKNKAQIALKNITAPFSGRLGLRKVEKGQYISPGQSLVWLQSLDPIWIDFPIPEGDVAKLKIGSPIELKVDAYPNEVFKGEVEAFDARVNQDVRTLMVRGRLPNPDHRLLPGMFANVAVLVGEPKEMVIVPRTAVTYGLYGDSVWVVKETPPEPVPASGVPVAEAATASVETTGSTKPADPPAEPTLIADRRFVRVGPTEDETVAILEGVSAGEQVITSGQLKLQPGAPVKIDNSDALKPQAVRPKM